MNDDAIESSAPYGGATGWRENTDEKREIQKGEVRTLNCTAGKRQSGLSPGPLLLFCLHTVPEDA